jgi:hypothetical protein
MNSDVKSQNWMNLGILWDISIIRIMSYNTIPYHYISHRIISHLYPIAPLSYSYSYPYRTMPRHIVPYRIAPYYTIIYTIKIISPSYHIHCQHHIIFIIGIMTSGSVVSDPLSASYHLVIVKSSNTWYFPGYLREPARPFNLVILIGLATNARVTDG